MDNVDFEVGNKSKAQQINDLANNIDNTDSKETKIEFNNQFIPNQNVAPSVSQNNNFQSDDPLKTLVNKMRNKHSYEPVTLPSRCLCYEEIGLKPNQPLHVRAMTISEEKLLATPRLVQNGEAINKIYENCIQEDINVDLLFSADRTFLLFYIRGISFGQDYSANIKCPSCSQTFEEDISLSQLPINDAEDNFCDDISTILPDCGLKIWYRLPRGKDEKQLINYRKQRIKGFGSGVIDDTIIQRNIILINRIQDLESGQIYDDRKQISIICNEFGIKDSNHLRDLFQNPPFGIDTKVNITCPLCYHEFEMEFPIDASFFFPKTKKV